MSCVDSSSIEPVEDELKFRPCTSLLDYVKIDRGLISICDGDISKQLTIRAIMNRASEFGAKVLA
ncbi:EAL domain-containing protein [Paenibacillus sp. S150]|uniref:EAL domain-containing protein n=1 Tax=Paenibacillus sp. S150 TaxID=2749826 RepID=UPI001C59F100|nr:EAL domain-containing protein [Paenibacillus sp. S150]MBW4085314.1 hypothetical protein [Paenibacillus sp. S150]